MDLNQLKTFLAVAEAGSFSRAAAALHRAQPSVTRQVQALETRIGLPLLFRTGRGATLTEAGVALRDHAKGIQDLVERARADMLERQRNPRGRITVGLPPRVAHVITADLVERFHARYPEAAISVVEGLSLRLREWLVAGRIDAAILFDPARSPPIQSELLVREPLVLISAAALPARLRLADVVQHRLVMPAAPHALRQLLEEQTGPRGLALQLVAEVDSVQTVLSLVARGVADTVLPVSAVRGWSYPTPVHLAGIHAPQIRNRLVLAEPVARPATRLTRDVGALLRELVLRHFGPQQTP